MSTLVQQNNSPHYPQSTMINSGDAAARQRPENQPSKNLQSDELHTLYDILGSSCVTLATAVAQVLHGNNGAWRKQACGVFCFVKDYDNRSYCFRLYDLRARHSIYQEIVPAALRLEKALDVFYTFDGMNCKIGLNFADRDEAQTFSHLFHSKQEDRQCKKDRKKSNPPLPKAPPPSVQPPAMSTMLNGVRPPSVNTVVHTLPTPAVTESTPKKSITGKSSGFFTLRKKKQPARVDISAPVQATFVHVGHIGTTESFFHDEKQKQLFEDVLSGLQISPEDKIYVRDYISTDGGLEKLLAKPTVPVRDYNGANQGSSSMAGGAPELPPRGFTTTGRNAGGRTPHQDVSVPPSTHNQSNNRSQPLQDLFTPPSGSNNHPAPSIPPRTGSRAPDNTYSSTQAPPAPPPLPPPQPPNGDFSRMQAPATPPPPPPPPPPLPTNWAESTPRSGGGIPPPPPPPPLSSPPAPGPKVSSGTTRNAPSIPPPTDDRDNLLDAIRNFNPATKLKQLQERPPIPQVQATPGDSSPGAPDTMATNILKILAERREKLIGPETADDSDSSQEDWSS